MDWTKWIKSIHIEPNLVSSHSCHTISSRVSCSYLNLICNSHPRTAQQSISICPFYFIPNKYLILTVTVYQFSNIKMSHLIIYSILSLQKHSRTWKKPIEWIRYRTLPKLDWGIVKWLDLTSVFVLYPECFYLDLGLVLCAIFGKRIPVTLRHLWNAWTSDSSRVEQ